MPALSSRLLSYQLGRSLYIPLTSRCNSIPLPITRGPGFVLGRNVVDVLQNVRRVEMETAAVAAACWIDAIDGSGDISNNSSSSSDSLYYGGYDNNNKVPLPEYNLPLVTSLYNNYGTDGHHHPDRNDQENIMTTTAYAKEDFLQPSIATLLEQVTSHLDSDTLDLHEVCIAGEGEPTLRMDALLAVARTVQSFNHEQQQQQYNNDDDDDDDDDEHSNRRRQINVRVITNGLCYTIPHLGYSPNTNNHNDNNPNTTTNTNLLPKLRYTLLRDLIHAGVTRISVALNTSNRHEYDVLMQPACYTGGGRMMIPTDSDDHSNHHQNDDDDGRNDNNNNASSSSSFQQPPPPMTMKMPPGTAHDLICEFIMDATRLGMDVEITGVDRPDIDKVEMERLARLLLSVGSSKNKQKKGGGGRVGQRRSAVRWRPYFE